MIRHPQLLVIVLVLVFFGCEGPQGPEGPPGTGLGSLSDPSIQPAVIYTYPPANGSGPYPDLYFYSCGLHWCDYFSQFQVRFNKFMDVSSVRRAVKLQSPLGDIFADTSFIVSIGGDVFILNPVDSNGYRSQFRFKVGGSYTMAVDSTARDINGNFLRPAFSINFVPEPYFRVTNSWPENGATDVYIQAYVGFQFNSQVDSSIIDHVSSTPELPGTWGFGYDSTTIYLQMSTAGLLTSTAYSIRIDQSAQDRDGNQLSGPFTLSFTTADFRVLYSYPADGAVTVPSTGSIGVTFTEPFDTSTLRSAFHLSPSTTGSFGFYYGGRDFSFTPSPGFLASTSYTVRIDSTVKSMRGMNLSASYEFSFTTAPFLITYTKPPDGAVNFYRGGTVFIYTNSPISQSSIAPAISLNPPHAISVGSDPGSSGFSFWPGTPFAAQTLYTITIDTTLQTLTGTRLGAPYVFSFSTGQ